MVADVIIIAFIVLYSLFVVRKIIRDKKKGVCTGCSASSCSACGRCNSDYFDTLIRNAGKKV